MPGPGTAYVVNILGQNVAKCSVVTGGTFGTCSTWASVGNFPFTSTYNQQFDSLYVVQSDSIQKCRLSDAACTTAATGFSSPQKVRNRVGSNRGFRHASWNTCC